MAIIAFGDAQTGMSTTTKYAIGAAAAAAVGALAWWMLKKKPAALKANKGKHSRKCPVCAATPKKTSTRCHRCGHNYGLRANASGWPLDPGLKWGVRAVDTEHGFVRYLTGYRSKAAAEKGARLMRAGLGSAAHRYTFSIITKAQVPDAVPHKAGGVPPKVTGRLLGHVLHSNRRMNYNPATKRAPGWQKKLYKGPATDWRTHAPPKYARYGATQASHYAFPEAFKYPIHGKDVATTKRFIRTAASRYAKFKMRIAPEYREAVGRRIEAAKRKYGIGEFNPKYARKTVGKAAKKRKVA